MSTFLHRLLYGATVPKSPTIHPFFGLMKWSALSVYHHPLVCRSLHVCPRIGCVEDESAHRQLPNLSLSVTKDRLRIRCHVSISMFVQVLPLSLLVAIVPFLPDSNRPVCIRKRDTLQVIGCRSTSSCSMSRPPSVECRSVPFQPTAPCLFRSRKMNTHQVIFWFGFLLISSSSRHPSVRMINPPCATATP